jgi:hypothetical protein
MVTPVPHQPAAVGRQLVLTAGHDGTLVTDVAAE